MTLPSALLQTELYESYKCTISVLIPYRAKRTENQFKLSLYKTGLSPSYVCITHKFPVNDFSSNSRLLLRQKYFLNRKHKNYEIRYVFMNLRRNHNSCF